MRTLFAGGQVFDGTGSAPSAADVVIEDGRIVEVGRGLDGEEVIDASGQTLIPGMFDCHTHVMVSHVDMWKMVQAPFSLMFYEAMHNLRRTLEIGITTIRDAGGADLGVKTAVDKGLIEGPRMQISIKMISQTGGHADDWMPSGAEVPFFPAYHGSPSAIVDGPIEMRRKVRELIRDGAAVIKVATSGGVLRAAEQGQQIPEASLQKAKEVVDVHRESFRKAVAAGAKVAMGTDSGVTPHGENLHELELMVEGGLSPEQALVATTKTAAELMGLERELGTIEPGKRADLVVIDGDPFDFAKLGDRVTSVFKDGRRVVGS